MSQFQEATRAHDLPRIQLLIDSGGNINEVDEIGMTALHYAAMLGFAQCAKLLLDNGAKTDIEAGHGNTALYLSQIITVTFGGIHSVYSNYPATTAAIRAHMTMTWQEKIEREPAFHDRTY